MIKKWSVFALLGVGWLGLGAMQAQAQNIDSQTFPFSGTCSGGNNIVGSPPIFFGFVSGVNGTLNPRATITGANLTLFQPPSGLQYAYLNVSGDGNQALVWLGPGGGSTSTFFGSAGNFNTNGAPEASPGNGINFPAGGGINVTLACSSGTWQAFGTIWYHVP